MWPASATQDECSRFKRCCSLSNSSSIEPLQGGIERERGGREKEREGREREGGDKDSGRGREREREREREKEGERERGRERGRKGRRGRNMTTVVISGLGQFKTSPPSSPVEVKVCCPVLPAAVVVVPAVGGGCGWGGAAADTLRCALYFLWAERRASLARMISNASPQLLVCSSSHTCNYRYMYIHTCIEKLDIFSSLTSIT